ncbi:uncharacterized protein N0V89_004479 [Didymosphaeria variabile]|uniref:F-box domain-containing protein n=1 Tax=Didymosphaeria variabile TaxID=1932322 RepID=A0A9W8XR93_9PLEO|nr:uncharacterized protein N0V89_004479 [Didymosphaeria variabile]KAJ4356446.1 hypothetical protein N0V89_004479 [Didymosphaeria variabile]
MAALSSSNLLKLPDELLLEILNYIDHFAYAWRTNSLYGLNLASRRLHALTKPYLYSTFSFYAGHPCLFLRTISLNPDLASQVKGVCWDYDTSAAGSFVYKPGVLAVKQEFQLDDACDKLQNIAVQGNLIARHLVASLTLGRLHLGDLRALEVLLMFTNNMEHLEVAETYRWDDHHYWFTPILCMPNNFLRLTSATLQGPMRSENVVGLMILPSMRCLELTQVVEMRQEQDRTLQWQDPSSNDPIFTGVFNQRSSNLEHLRLLDSYTQLQDVMQILRTTPSLKSFVYEHIVNELSLHYLDMPYDNLNQILELQRETLTSLRISAMHSWDPIPLPAPWEDENVIFEAVQDFPKLTHLEVSYSCTQSRQWLYRAPKWEQLPPNLEHLTIDYLSAHEYIEHTEGTAELEQGLEDLAIRKRRGELPKLRSVAFNNWHPYYGSFPRDISIGKVLGDVGIQLMSIPARIGSTTYMMEDIGWVELQSELDWVIIEIYRVDEE